MSKQVLHFTDSIYRRLVLQKIARLQQGRISIRDAGLPASVEAGDSAAALSASLRVVRPRAYRRIVWSGGLGAAEAIMAGDLECDDMTALVRVFIRNLAVADQVEGGTARISQLAGRIRHWLRRNYRDSARRNIAQHYDLGNEFYRLWLDPSLNYSCGFFASEDDSLQEAQVAKMDRVCRQLELSPDDHLLEIGTGWGGFAIHAARNYGCRVTTTTISKAQHELATARIAAAGLADRVTVLCQDYRQLAGRFDKLVSIEMIEAVGHQYYPTFFRQCGKLLKRDGRMLVQAIVIADQRYEQHIRTVDFISQYIFPGGSLPAISVLTQVAAQAAGLRVARLDEFGAHYAETLRRWRANFEDQLDHVRGLGFDERFIRMWRYYLCYCEAAFMERQIHLVQMLFAQRDCPVDPLLAASGDEWRPPDAGRLTDSVDELVVAEDSQ